MKDPPDQLRLYDNLRLAELKRYAAREPIDSLRVDLDTPPLTIAINAITNLRTQQRRASNEVYKMEGRSILSDNRWTALETAILQLFADLIPILDRLEPLPTKTGD